MKGLTSLALFFGLVLFAVCAYAGELVNGNFEAGMDPWSPYIEASAKADVKLVDTGGIISGKCVLANITTTSGTNWHVGVTQDNVTVMSGQTYTASLFLKADKARKASIEFKRSPAAGAWEGISSMDFDITTNWAEYYLTFKPVKDYPDLAFLGIWIAQVTGQVWVDGVRLGKGEYSAASAIEPKAKITTLWGVMKVEH